MQIISLGMIYVNKNLVFYSNNVIKEKNKIRNFFKEKEEEISMFYCVMIFCNIFMIFLYFCVTMVLFLHGKFGFFPGKNKEIKKG